LPALHRVIYTVRPRGVGAVAIPDKIATNEQTSSRHQSETITPAAGDREKSQVSGQGSGRRPGLEAGTYGLKVYSCGGITGFDLEKGMPDHDA
jgi:hypothetical protein